MREEDNLERIGHAMMIAWGRMKKTQAKMWAEWMVIGEGLIEGRRWAMQQAGTDTPDGRGYNTAFNEWLKRYKVDDMDPSDRAKLLQIMEERPAVEEWRQTLPTPQRRNLNNPTLVYRKWDAATRVKKKKPRRTIEESQEDSEQLQERVKELEEEAQGAADNAALLNDACTALDRCAKLLPAGKVQGLMSKSLLAYWTARELEEVP
jgi:hypothetical protein